jgi:hypothetical protein
VRPAAAQVNRVAGCYVNERESPWVTLFTGTWRARLGPTASGCTAGPVMGLRLHPEFDQRRAEGAWQTLSAMWCITAFTSDNRPLWSSPARTG